MDKILFFGTEHFAAAMLQSLVDAKSFDIVGVVTQPDRPVGRKQLLEETPVATLATTYQIPLIKPDTLKNFELPFTGYDYAAVCQYGLIIPERIIKSAPAGFINVHPSLLPRWRGASPLQSTIIAGDKETAVSIMIMDKEMDHGPILSQQVVAVDPNETYEQLSLRLEPIAGELLVHTLKDWREEKIAPKEQDRDQVVFCKTFTREDGKVAWTNTAEQIYNAWRGLNPWPGLWTTLDGKRLKLITVKPSTDELTSPAGTIHFTADKRVLVSTGALSLELLTIQPEGSRVLNGHEFTNGFGRYNDQILGL